MYSHGATVLAPRTDMVVFTNTTGDARVSACNDDGRSGLSLSNLVVTQQPQCAAF